MRSGMRGVKGYGITGESVGANEEPQKLRGNVSVALGQRVF
jgi:hypothetical protein